MVGPLEQGLGAWAARRPDGGLAVLLVNRDLVHARRLVLRTAARRAQLGRVTARGAFIELRSSVLEAARTLAVTAPAQTAIDGLKALEAVVRALAEATAHEARRTTLAEARRRVLAVLDRIMTINHVDDPNFAALLECQAKAREIRAAVLDPKGPTEESAAVIMETTPAFSPRSLVATRSRRLRGESARSRGCRRWR